MHDRSHSAAGRLLAKGVPRPDPGSQLRSGRDDNVGIAAATGARILLAADVFFPMKSSVLLIFLFGLAIRNMLKVK